MEADPPQASTEDAPTESRTPTSVPEVRLQLESLSSRLSAASEKLADWELWFRLIDLAECRRDLDAEAPIVTVLLGPTGAGKSTLFNQIVSQPLSQPGAIRPFTSQPLIVGSAKVIEVLKRDPALSSEALELRWVSADDLPERIGENAVVDTPDFDSVEASNRDRALAMLYRADRIVAVLTPEKYGDAIVWDLLEELQPLGNITAVLFNKTDGPAPLEDCARVLSTRGLPAPVSIPRLPDPERLNREELEPILNDLFASTETRQEIHADRLEQLIEYERRTRERSITPFIRSVTAAATEISSALSTIESTLPARIERRLSLELDSALKRELERKFLAEVQRIDILRTPRRWISAPVDWLTSPFRSKKESDPNDDLPTAEWLTNAYRDRFEEFVLELIDELRRTIEKTKPVDQLEFPWPAVDPPEDAVRDAALLEIFRGLEQEIVRESERIAEGLPLTGKLSFYGSQVVFHALITTVCIKTGGLLTPAELATQGLVSPFVARILGSVVSGQQAEEVQARLEATFASLVSTQVEILLAPLRTSLEEATSGLPDFESWTRLEAEWDKSLRGGTA